MLVPFFAETINHTNGRQIEERALKPLVHSFLFQILPDCSFLHSLIKYTHLSIFYFYLLFISVNYSIEGVH